MGRIPNSLALVELPFWAVVSETEGTNRLIRNPVNAGVMAAYHRAGLPMEGLAMKTRSKNHTGPETASVLGLWGLTIGPALHKGPSDQNPIKTSTPMLRTGSTPWEGHHR